MNTDSTVIQGALQDFGLGPSETAVFTALLSLGSRQASTLAKHTGISRAHIYGILDKLVKRELVSVHERDGVRHFSALSVDDLITAIEQKEQSLAARRRQLREAVYSINKPSSHLWTDPRTRSGKGPETRARVFQELTREEPEPAVLFCSADASALFEDAQPGKDALLQLMRLVPTGFIIVLFSSDSAAEQLAAELDLPAVIPMTGVLPAEMVVSGNRVTLVGKRGQSPCSITVEQPALAANLRELGRSLLAGPAREI